MESEDEKPRLPLEERRALRRDALAGGDDAKEAFSSLWLDYWPRVLGFSRSWFGGAGPEAEDAAQEILIRAFLKLGSYDPERELEPWLFSLARRYLSGLARSEARRVRRESAAFSLDAGIDADGEKGMIRDEELTRMKRAIGALAPRDRALIELVYDEGMSSGEVGLALGMAAGTVRWRLASIREELRKRMEDGDGRA
jgi:RNA polymerase sigma factor (sigma-70 family)